VSWPRVGCTFGLAHAPRRSGPDHLSTGFGRLGFLLGGHSFLGDFGWRGLGHREALGDLDRLGLDGRFDGRFLDASDRHRLGLGGRGLGGDGGRRGARLDQRRFDRGGSRGRGRRLGCRRDLFGRLFLGLGPRADPLLLLAQHEAAAGVGRLALRLLDQAVRFEHTLDLEDFEVVQRGHVALDLAEAQVAELLGQVLARHAVFLGEVVDAFLLTQVCSRRTVGDRRCGGFAVGPMWINSRHAPPSSRRR
jgi:hypothetical protein